MLLAHCEAGIPGAPHLLYYGHYDVQPAEPLELWRARPSNPPSWTARTVSAWSRAARWTTRAGDDLPRSLPRVEGGARRLPVTVTALIEGEEESGSASLPGFLAEHAATLSKAAVAMISDTNSWDIDTPAITSRLRGNVYVEVTLDGPSRDLHSGLYGGAVVNPLNALTEALGQLHGPGGRVQIPGFYDGVAELPAEERRAWAALPLDEAAFLSEIGLTQSVGEPGYSLLRAHLGAANLRPARHLGRLHWTRLENRDRDPRLRQAELPHRAGAGPGQNFAGLASVSGRADAARLQMEHRGDGRLGRHSRAKRRAVHAGGARGARRYLRQARRHGGLRRLDPRRGPIREELGLNSILVGFGLSDDRIHSPNEKFELKCLKNGILSHAAILARIEELPRTVSYQRPKF